MKKTLILTVALFLFLNGIKAQDSNSELSKQQVNEIIKKIKTSYYAIKNKEQEDIPYRKFTFTIDAGPDIPAIGYYKTTLNYDMMKGFATVNTYRANTLSEYYEFFYMDWGLAFIYEKSNSENTQMRMYFYKGKIIKAYTKDENGKINNKVNLDLDYKKITTIIDNFKDVFNTNCGCDDEENY